jgi:hypothetical protein
MIVKQLRRDTDIKWIVIHNTTNADSRSGSNINSNYQQSGYFGNPYDVTVNIDGSIDLSPVWTYQSNAAVVYSNAKIVDITRYPLHYMSGIGENYDYSRYAIHIALSGNFNINRPLSSQVNTLVNVLNQVVNFYQIDPRMYLYYHSDFVNTSCPGIQMIPKSQLIAALTYTAIPTFVVQKFSVDTVIDPFFINFTGSNVEVKVTGDITNIIYTFGVKPPSPPAVSLDTSMDITVDASDC